MDGELLDGPRWGPVSGAAEHLLVLLHGVGADGHDLISLAPHWGARLPGVAFVAFDAPQRYDQAPIGRQWFSLADRTPEVMQAGAAEATPVLLASIEAELARLQIASVAILGFSQGAMMGLFAGLRRTPPPSAIVAFSGALLAVPTTVPQVPVLLVHGNDDNVVPVERSHRAQAMLQAAGVRVQAIYRPGLTHAIDEAGLMAAAAFLRAAFAIA